MDDTSESVQGSAETQNLRRDILLVNIEFFKITETIVSRDERWVT